MIPPIPHQRVALALANRFPALRAQGTPLSRELALVELELRSWAQTDTAPSAEQVNTLGSQVSALRRQGTALSADLALLELELRELGLETPESTVAMPRHPSPAVLTAFAHLVGMDPLPENAQDGYPITGNQSTVLQWYQKLFAVLVAHQAEQPTPRAVNADRILQRLRNSGKRAAALHGKLIHTIHTNSNGETVARMMRKRDAAFSRFNDRLVELASLISPN